MMILNPEKEKWGFPGVSGVPREPVHLEEIKLSLGPRQNHLEIFLPILEPACPSSSDLMFGSR